MHRLLFAGVLWVCLLSLETAWALPDGPADPEATGDGSLEFLVAYTGVIVPALALSAEDSDVERLEMQQPGLMHGLDIGFGGLFRYFALVGSVGFTLGGEAATDDVELSSDYLGTAFAGGAEPNLDLFMVRARLLPLARIPLGYVAILGGAGFGFDYWDASPADSEDVTDEISEGMFGMPLTLRFDVKPACGFVLVAQGGYNIGLTGPAIQYPFFSVGLGYQGCTEQSEPSYEPTPYVAPAPVPVTPAPAGPFQAEQVQGLGDPEIVIVNTTDLVINIEVSGPTSETIVLQPRVTERRVMPPGTYTYSASAEGVGSTSGSNTFNADNRYTWVFELRDTPQPPPSPVPAP